MQPVREQVGCLLSVRLSDVGIAARLLEIEEAGSAPSRARLPVVRSFPQQLPHQPARAVARNAVDDHELDVVLTAREEMGVGIARLARDDEQVGPLSGLDGAEGLVPAEELRRVPRRQRDQVVVRERGPVEAVDEACHLELSEQVLAPARRPVRAERDRDPCIVCLLDVRGLPVEEQVAERRPDHGRAALAQHLEVLLLQRDAVDPGQGFRDCPVPVRPLQRQEVRPRLVVRALAQVEQQALVALEPLQELVAVLRLDVGDVRRGLRELGLVRLLDVADDALVEALDPRVARERDALRRRRPADQALALDVAHDRRHVLRRVREHLHRARDQLAVRVALGPLVAVRVLLGHVPELERVVAQVVVEVDQAGVDRPLRVDDRDFLEPGGRRVGRLLNGRDRPALHVDRAVVDDVLSVVHRHHTAVDRECRPVERIDGRPEDVAHGVSLLGATQTSVWPSSGEGRETWLLCRGWPVRPAASSPRKSGTPNGRSRRGIGA